MLLEWTLRLLAATFPSGRGEDALGLWAELEDTPLGLVPAPKIVFVNEYPATATVDYCSEANVAQLVAVRAFVREAISALKGGIVISHYSVETALWQLVPEFLGVVMLIASRRCQEGITFITNPVLASSVGDEECLLNLEAWEQCLPELIKQLRSTAVRPIRAESAGKEMELIPWGDYPLSSE